MTEVSAATTQLLNPRRTETISKELFSCAKRWIACFWRRMVLHDQGHKAWPLSIFRHAVRTNQTIMSPMNQKFWFKNPLHRSNSMNVRSVLRPSDGAQTRGLTRRSSQVEPAISSQVRGRSGLISFECHYQQAAPKNLQAEPPQLLPAHEKLSYGEVRLKVHGL
eukprot:761684-Hanusia_phi.AAC.12